MLMCPSYFMSNNVNTEQMRGKGVMFSRIRRITGYLVGDMKHWGTGKRAEEGDRIKHDTNFISEQK